MYLSRVELQPARRDTMLALANLQLLHGAIEQSFPGERKRRLWRLDWLDSRCWLLVLSQQKPDFTGVLTRFGDPSIPAVWETKPYDPLLEQLQKGQCWRFRLKANPVRSAYSGTAGEKRGKVMAHVTPVQQKQWLLTRAETMGIALEDEAFDVVHTQWYSFNKGQRQKVTLRTASFEGVLTITDAQRFRDTLQTGVGRAKAYGCGLMTVMRYGGGHNG